MKGLEEQIHYLTCPLHTNLKDNIIDYIRSQGDRQNRGTNVQAYMTQWNTYNDDIRTVIDWIIEQIPTDRKLWSVDTWGAIYNKGDFTTIHHHNTAYSWVYFLQTPKGSSPLLFPISRKTIEPKEGYIIIFPGQMRHSVPPNNCDDRIVLAGNINEHNCIQTPNDYHS